MDDNILKLREPLGAFVERQPGTAVDKRIVLAGRPEADYVTVQFTSKFAKKADVQELVTTVREPDGRWRVTGYQTSSAKSARQNAWPQSPRRRAARAAAPGQRLARLGEVQAKRGQLPAHPGLEHRVLLQGHLFEVGNVGLAGAQHHLVDIQAIELRAIQPAQLLQQLAVLVAGNGIAMPRLQQALQLRLFVCWRASAARASSFTAGLLERASASRAPSDWKRRLAAVTCRK